MRLGFHFHVPAYQDGNKIRMPGYLGTFIDGLAPKFEHIVCFLHSPLSYDKQFIDYKIKSKNVILINIGSKRRVYIRELFWPFYLKHYYFNKKLIDVLLIRGPSPLLPYFSLLTKEIPKVFMLVADQLKGLEDLQQPKFRRKMIILWSNWNRILQDKCIRNEHIIVNSKKLLDDNINISKSIKTIKTTTLYKKDLYYREDTCKNEVVHLLYTGRMDRGKGLFEMVDALHLLVNDGINANLNFVGWADDGDPIIAELKKYANDLKIIDKVIFHGFQPLGKKLFSFYKQSDVYVIASKRSEGFPRTIWEAMAHSLPVVATRVGSISHYLSNENNALLVEPNSPHDLFQAIKIIIKDKKIRRRITKNSFSLVSKQTIENRSEELANHIKEIID
jgi:glycosyltransferase involved in cell wall biosynthesis